MNCKIILSELSRPHRRAPKRVYMPRRETWAREVGPNGTVISTWASAPLNLENQRGRPTAYTLLRFQRPTSSRHRQQLADPKTLGRYSRLPSRHVSAKHSCVARVPDRGLDRTPGLALARML